MERLTGLVNMNVRATDEKGRIGRFVLGLMLVDTPETGARAVVDRLEAIALREKLHVKFETRAYSPDDIDSNDQSDVSGGQRNSDRSYTVELAGADLGRTLRVDRPASELGVMRQSMMHAVAKRGIDIAGAAIGLVIAAPIIAMAALAVRATSSGPAFFTQQREGKNGRVFRIFKLRTMFTGAEAQQAALRALSERDGPAFKMKNDPRVTPVGNFLRNSCIDELPQLLNVLMGHMSLVGPRPLPVHESRACAVWHRRRLDVRPGITCHWQINKGSVESFDDWMRLDLAYVDRGSLWSDFRLMLKTITVPLAGRGSD
jgi:lipopolysaccharide/colanic/teichoic acid biosynthesis glycosyltransferase